MKPAPLPPSRRRRRRPRPEGGDGEEGVCLTPPCLGPLLSRPLPPSSAAREAAAAAVAAAPPQPWRRRQLPSPSSSSSAAAAAATSPHRSPPPWRLLSVRGALLSLAVVVALFGAGAAAWRLPAPLYGWERRKRAGAMQPLGAVGQPQRGGGSGTVEEGQQPGGPLPIPPAASSSPTTTTAPAASGERRQPQRRAAAAAAAAAASPRPPSSSNPAAPTTRSSSSPSSSSVPGMLAGGPGEEAMVAQLEEIRRRKRRGELRGLVRRLDLASLEAQGSVALLEAVARAAGACQDATLAWDALQRLLAVAGEQQQQHRRPWVPRWDTFSLVMSACRRRRDLDALLRAFKAALPYPGQHSTTILLNILLAGLCDGGRMDVAAFYLDTAEGKWGVQPNTVSWNTLLSAAVREGPPKLVAELEARMAARGVDGDVTTRNIRLQHLLATRPLEEALAYFDGLQREQAAYVQTRGRPPASGDEAAPMDLRTLNILTSHLARARGFDDAAAVVEAMRQRGLGIAPRAVTHNILLDALLKAGRVDEALEYFYGVAAEAAREPDGGGGGGGAPPMVDSTTYDILLSGLVQNGRVSTAVVVHSMMLKAGLPPTVYTFAALLRLQKSASDVYRLWAQARSACGPRLSLPFLNLLTYELGHTHGDLEGALAAFRAILRTPGLGAPNTISYNSLLSALVRDANAAVPGPLTAGTVVGVGAGNGGDRRRGRGRVEAEEEEEEAAVVVSGGGVSRVGEDEEAGATLSLRGLGGNDGGGGGGGRGPQQQETLALLDSLSGKPVLEAALAVLRSLYAEGSPARPNARTFTILLAGIGKAASTTTTAPTIATGTGSSLSGGGKSKGSTALCVGLYREAEAQGVEANGIMAHALLRAFGPDAPGALAFFKKELRVRLKALDRRRTQVEQQQEAVQEQENGADDTSGDDAVPSLGTDGGGHLSLAYLALLHVCGLAGRADLALQSVYAMQRDGLRADRRAWDAFASGKDAAALATAGGGGSGSGSGTAPSPASASAAAPGTAAGALEASSSSSSSSSSLLMAPYESLLRAETLGWEGGETFFKRIRIRF